MRSTSPERVMSGPQRDEMVPLRERASMLEMVRVVFVLAVVAAAILLPEVAATHRGAVVWVSLGYLVISAAPQALGRLGRRPMLGLLQASLLIDGLYLAWVMLQTGGIESPFRILVFVHIVAVTLAASYRTGL